MPLPSYHLPSSLQQREECSSLCSVYKCTPFTPSYHFPCGSAGEEFACNAGDVSSVPGLGRSPGEGKEIPTQVFWPGEFHGLYSPWGHKKHDSLTITCHVPNCSFFFSYNTHRCANTTLCKYTFQNFHFDN